MSKSRKPILTGMGVSKGITQGIVRLIMSDADTTSFEEGEILVTHITDPTMTPMMMQASAIVCDIGGMTSHPSIVSREMGIPCVVATEHATSKLKSGMKIEVNGETGEVYEI